MVHPPPGPERAAHVAEPRDRIGEEHRAEAGEDEVERGPGQRNLGVAAREAQVLDPGLLAVSLRGGQEGVAAVHAHDLAFGPDDLGELDRGVAEPAADVEHAVPGPHRQLGEHHLAVTGQPLDENVAKADEFGRQDLVPKSHGLGVLGRRHSLAGGGLVERTHVSSPFA